MCPFQQKINYKIFVNKGNVKNKRKFLFIQIEKKISAQISQVFSSFKAHSKGKLDPMLSNSINLNCRFHIYVADSLDTYFHQNGKITKGRKTYQFVTMCADVCV